MRHLPKFAYDNVDGASSPELAPSVSDPNDDGTEISGTSTISQISVRGRGTKRGRDAARARENLMNERRARTEERNKQFGEVAKNMASISQQFLNKSRAAVIMQALQVAPEGERKEKLKEKLMILALEM